MDDVRDVAARAVRAGGDYLAEEFRNGSVAGEYGTDDVKTVADREAEARVIDVLSDAFPDHAVHGEESGRRGEGRYEWVVDPLDGTNNFASGIPTFATAAALLDDDEPVCSAIYEPLTDDLYLAERGAGATVNGDPVTATSERDLAHGTVSLVVGLPAVWDERLRAVAGQVETALRGRSKRVVQTWAPCVDWGLVATGRLEGIVCFHPDVYEQHAGELLAAESGVASHSREGLYVGAPTASQREALVTAVESVLDGS
jgi:myo-inositol-1(or 4)-monophosphatase